MIVVTDAGVVPAASVKYVHDGLAAVVLTVAVKSIDSVAHSAAAGVTVTTGLSLIVTVTGSTTKQPVAVCVFFI